MASEGGRLASELQAVGGLLTPFPAATKNPLAMALNVPRLARLIVEERRRSRSRPFARAGLGRARRVPQRGRPFVTTYHGAYSGRSGLKLLYNSVMARGDVVIANSQLHRRRDRAALSDRPPALARHSARHGRAFRAGRGRAGAGGAAARGLGRRAARARRAGRRAAHRWKEPEFSSRRRACSRSAGLEEVRYILAGDAQGRGRRRARARAPIATRGLTGVVSGSAIAPTCPRR